MNRYLLASALLLAPALGAQDTAAPTQPAQPPKDDSSLVETWENGLPELDTPIGEFRIGGYASFQHRTLTRYNGGESENFFDAIRIVPKLHWQIVDWLEFGMEIEFEGGGVGPSYLTDNEIIIEYAELHATPLPELNFKAGILLVPFGRYNSNHDDIAWDLADRPFVARRVIPSAFMQPGAGIFGAFNQVPYFGFTYDLSVTQGLKDSFTNNGGARDARNSMRKDNNGNKAIWFHMGVIPRFDEMGTDLLEADLGLSYTYQEIGPDNSQSLRGVGVDGALQFNILERFGIDVAGEWSRLWINRDSSAGTTNGLWGYFVDVLFKFDPFPASWRGETFGQKPYIGLIFRLEENDLNDDHVGTAARDDRIAITGGISFRPISKLVFRIEYKHQQSKRRDDGDETRLVFSLSVGL